jgi:hypothetical protein
MAQWVGVRALNRARGVRINSKTVKWDATTYIDVDDAKTRRDLQHHTTLGAVTVVGSAAAPYTTATKPAAASVPAGTIIFVSDGGAGAVFQGSTGSAWVNLG